MKQLRTVLVVDDDDAMCDMLISMLDEAGFLTQRANSAVCALEKIRSNEFGAVLSDIRMPNKDGLELLGEIREIRPDTPVILMTAFGSIDTAVEAMAAGAFHYITKPFRRKEVLLILERALEHRATEEENRRLRLAVDQTTRIDSLVGESAFMKETFALIRKVACNRATVLIKGESGTGKETIARTIHFSGSRSEHPFIPFYCTSVPENQLESELFGYLHGALGSSDPSRRGIFEQADGGTLFLGEIDTVPFTIQSKLLRALESQKITPAGGETEIPVDVRVIAATSHNLRDFVEAGEFRRDLYYRLNVIPIEIPPLRDRPEDIRPLAKALVRKHAADPHIHLSELALQKLEMSNWEGNAHELENTIERVLALSDGLMIGPEEFSALEASDRPLDKIEGDLFEAALERRLTLNELQERYIAEIIESTGGNKAKAAEILGVNRRTLYRRSKAMASCIKKSKTNTNDG